MKKLLAAAFLLLWTAACLGTAFAEGHSVETAHTAFRHGRADDALRVLNEAIQENAGNAAAWNLQCQVYLAQGRSDDAIGSCRQAVQLAPTNSGFHLWLGRAYGQKASRAGMVTAYRTAKLVRAEFESAVSLDAKNREALADLGQYYVEAPKILGGGYDKAEDLAKRLTALDQARADELRARIAEANKDYAGAERNLRAKIAESQSSESSAQAWMDLGSFYERRGRWSDMLTALRNGAAADIHHGPALVDGASTLILAKRETTLAARWLREYLSSGALSETAPAFAVHAELGNLLKRQGDGAGADREFAAAHALSADYTETAMVNTGD